MWSRIVGALAGLAIAIASVVLLYSLAITPILKYDYDGFEMLQTKSGVYTRGFTLEEALGVRSGNKMYNEAHVLMLPAIDAQTQFSSTATGNGRVIRIYEHDAARNVDMMPLRVGGNYTFTGSGSFSWGGVSYFPPAANIDGGPWIRTYQIDTGTIYNKSITFKSWLSSGGTPQYNGTLLMLPEYQALKDLSDLNDGFNLMVNGAPRSSDLLFYTGNKPERYVWLIEQFPE